MAHPVFSFADWLSAHCVAIKRKRHLPDSNAGSRLCEWSPENPTQFERVGPNLNQIVRKCPERSHREDGREEEDVAKLKKELQIVIKRTLHTTNM